LCRATDVRIEFDEQTFVVLSAEKIGQVARKSAEASDQGNQMGSSTPSARVKEGINAVRILPDAIDTPGERTAIATRIGRAKICEDRRAIE
jgi:hypothetical protein